MVGVDLVFIPEFQQQLQAGGEAFMRKAFNTAEMRNGKVEHLAGLWAAKEAVYKAAEKPPEQWTDIVITHEGSGKPHAYIGDQQFAISISHHGDYAVAVAQRITV